jgi:putative endopeptidase
LRAVFRDHVQKLDWMSDETKTKALLKFDSFSQKLGYPDKFADYSPIDIRRHDYFGNVRRSVAFEVHNQSARIGKPVNKSAWWLTPHTVNAYFNKAMNEIVFPAGILQPPYFDMSMDDAVNYGGIGIVIGHEITHGYDDEGRHYDANGILNEWWTDKDSREFDRRAKKVVDEYNGFTALPGLPINGKLTLGENIADLGGVSIAYDALERLLAKDPYKRKIIDGLTPEQRFFISYGQSWRAHVSDPETRRWITVDPHPPDRFRVIGPITNYQFFYDAFGIKPGAPMWRAPELRAQIW